MCLEVLNISPCEEEFVYGNRTQYPNMKGKSIANSTSDPSRVRRNICKFRLFCEELLSRQSLVPDERYCFPLRHGRPLALGTDLEI